MFIKILLIEAADKTRRFIHEQKVYPQIKLRDSYLNHLFHSADQEILSGETKS